MAAIQSKRFCSTKGARAEEMMGIIEQAVTSGRPIPLTLLCGPLKNRRLRIRQAPDWAEFFQYVQLARLQQTVKAVYPPGIHIELLLDDARAAYANNVPWSVFHTYASGVEELVRTLNIHTWVTVRSMRTVYDMLNVLTFVPEAERIVHEQIGTHGGSLGADAVRNAWENCVDDSPAQEAVMRYLVAQQAETLAGFWRCSDRMLLRYGRNPTDIHRMWSVRKGSSDLPWQGMGGIAQFPDGELRPCVWQHYRACRFELIDMIPLHTPTPGLPHAIPFFQAICSESSDTCCSTCPTGTPRDLPHAQDQRGDLVQSIGSTR